MPKEWKMTKRKSQINSAYAGLAKLGQICLSYHRTRNDIGIDPLGIVSTCKEISCDKGEVFDKVRLANLQ